MFLRESANMCWKGPDLRFYTLLSLKVYILLDPLYFLIHGKHIRAHHAADSYLYWNYSSRYIYVWKQFEQTSMFSDLRLSAVLSEFFVVFMWSEILANPMSWTIWPAEAHRSISYVAASTSLHRLSPSSRKKMGNPRNRAVPRVYFFGIISGF